MASIGIILMIYDNQLELKSDVRKRIILYLFWKLERKSHKNKKYVNFTVYVHRKNAAVIYRVQT